MGVIASASNRPPHYYVDDQGILREQAGTVKQPHIARVRASNRETITTIELMTGLSAEQLIQLQVNMAIEWLTHHLSTPDPAAEWVNDLVEGDVYLLMTRPEIRGWWLNHWHRRDRNIVPALADEAVRMMKATSAYHFPLSTARREVRQMIRSKYQSFHGFCLAENTDEYKALSDSYAKLW